MNKMFKILEKLPSGEEVEYEVPVKGSLGLLAIGSVGLKAWRETRKRNLKKKRNNSELKNETDGATSK